MEDTINYYITQVYNNEPFITDKYGVKYSLDGKRLIKGVSLDSYNVKEGTEIICDSAFQSLEIKRINLPNTVKAIGICAFANNNMLQELNIPINVEYIALNNFIGGCVKLVELNIHSPLFHIVNNLILSKDNRILYGALHIKNDCIYLPQEVEIIAPNAFWGNKSIKHLLIPHSVKEIGHNAFCKSFFQSVNFNCELNKIPSECFAGATILSVNLKNNLNIEAQAFFMSSINLPEHIIVNGDVPEYAFCYCKGIKTVRIINCSNIGKSAFSHSSIKQIIVESKLERIEESAFNGCLNLEKCDFLQGTKYIANNAFYSCGNLKEINLNEFVPKLQYSTFCDCPKLKSFGELRQSFPQFINAINENEYCFNCGICQEIAKYSLVQNSPYIKLEKICNDIIQSYQKCFNTNDESEDNVILHIKQYLKVFQEYGWPPINIPRNFLFFGEAAMIVSRYMSKIESRKIQRILSASEMALAIKRDSIPQIYSPEASAILIFILLSEQEHLLSDIFENLNFLDLEYKDAAIAICEYLFPMAIEQNNELKKYIPRFDNFIGFNIQFLYKIRYDLCQQSFSSLFKANHQENYETLKNISEKILDYLISASISFRKFEFE